MRSSFQENGRVLSVETTGDNLDTNQTMDNMRSPTDRTSRSILQSAQTGDVSKNNMSIFK